jgi:hypothetical protein
MFITLLHCISNYIFDIEVSLNGFKILLEIIQISNSYETLKKFNDVTNFLSILCRKISFEVRIGQNLSQNAIGPDSW